MLLQKEKWMIPWRVAHVSSYEKNAKRKAGRKELGNAVYKSLRMMMIVKETMKSGGKHYEELWNTIKVSKISLLFL